MVLRHILVDGFIILWGFDSNGQQLVRLREGKSHVFRVGLMLEVRTDHIALSNPLIVQSLIA
jgi:hypothetical protein